MNSFLRLTVRFLQPLAHGRGDGGEPEWPPSPLRMYQALVAAAAARWNERSCLEYAVPALRWLVECVQPKIVAAVGTPSELPTQFYVPDNTADLLVPQWKKGEVNTTPKRTDKVVLPTHLHGDSLHYLYPLPPEGCPHLEVLKAAARSITHLGWGIDMVAADADIIDDEQAAKLPGEVWRPAADGSGTALRVPKPGTLDDLMRKHKDFLNRLSGDGFRPVPPLSCFKVVNYRRATETAGKSWCAFSILKPDASGNRAFDTARRASHVAAWVRHATGEVCETWPDVASFVHGHPVDNDKTQIKGEQADQRFQFLPLPTIEHRGELGLKVGSIRRVLIAAPSGCQEKIDFIRRRLPGQELVWDGKPIGLLNILPTNDWVLKQYTGSSTTWSTVTPVIWPGYDDRDAVKAEKLLRKAFVDAGISKELVAGIGPEDLEWRQVAFRAGPDLAKNYARPDKLTGSMYHVRVRFAHKVKGPLAIGAGRYRGFGLFAADPS